MKTNKSNIIIYEIYLNMFPKNSVLSYAFLYSNKPLFVLSAVVSLQHCEGSAGGSDASSPSTSFKPCSPLSQGDASAVRSTKRKNDSETQSLLEQKNSYIKEDGPMPGGTSPGRQCGIWVRNCPVLEANADVEEGEVRGRNNAANSVLTWWVTYNVCVLRAQNKENRINIVSLKSSNDHTFAKHSIKHGSLTLCHIPPKEADVNASELVLQGMDGTFSTEIFA